MGGEGLVWRHGGMRTHVEGVGAWRLWEVFGAQTSSSQARKRGGVGPS